MASRIIGKSSSIDEILKNTTHIPDRFIKLIEENAQQIRDKHTFFIMNQDIDLAEKVNIARLGCIKHELLANTVSLLKRNGFG